jgi:hypothetical protein
MWSIVVEPPHPATKIALASTRSGHFIAYDTPI